jgi:hypothetical protein
VTPASSSSNLLSEGVARHAAATVAWVVLATAKDDWGCFVLDAA